VSRRTMDQRIAVAVVYVAAMFMAIMDTTIVNVALPTLGRQFRTSPVAVDAVAIAFLVSLAVCIPASGWVGDRLGGRRTLLIAIVVFTVASALCGTATSLGALVGYRVLQGVGGGLMTPVGLAMLFRVYPPEERVRASSILLVPTALAPALGPVLGGLLVTDVSWRWVFYVNVPIGVAAVLFGAVFLADHRDHRPGRFDVVGFVLAGVGLAAVMDGLSEGPVTSWTSPSVLAALVVGVVLLMVMVVVELRTTSPIVDLRLFTDRLFLANNLVMLLGSVAFLGVLYLVALFFQDGLGQDALQSGLNTFPEALGVMLGGQVVSRALYPRVGPRRTMAVALVGVAATMGLLGLVGLSTDLWLVRLDMVAMGLCMSGVFVAATAAAFATVSPQRTGNASTLFNVQRYLGGAVGVAVLTTVLAAVRPVVRRAGHLAPHLAAYHTAFAVAAGISLVGALAALLVDDRAAAATMVRSGDAADEGLPVLLEV
jgi:EmrB/QacA subfamily drug resistance transporter